MTSRTANAASAPETTQPDALPGVTHLLAADDALAEQFYFGVFVTVCGQVVRRSELAPAECPEGCECDLALYCPQCVSQAAELSAKARPGTAQDGSRESCSAVPWDH